MENVQLGLAGGKIERVASRPHELVERSPKKAGGGGSIPPLGDLPHQLQRELNEPWWAAC